MNLRLIVLVGVLASCDGGQPGNGNNSGDLHGAYEANSTNSSTEPNHTTFSIHDPSPNRDESSRRRSEIDYGVGGGNLLLGDSEKQALDIRGAPQYRYSFEQPCKFTEWTWVDAGDKGNGVTAYFQNGKVFQLKFADTRITTREGIRFGTSDQKLTQLYARYDKSRMMSLLITDGDFAPDFPRYLVDYQKGVAFKLNHRNGEKRDQVWAIEVFEPSSEFVPNGCLADKSKFVASIDNK